MSKSLKLEDFLLQLFFDPFSKLQLLKIQKEQQELFDAILNQISSDISADLFSLRA